MNKPIHTRPCKHFYGYLPFTEGSIPPKYLPQEITYCACCGKYFTINERMVVLNRITKKSRLLTSILA